MSFIKEYNKKYLEILNGNFVIKGNYTKLFNKNIIINEDIYRLVFYEKFYNFLTNSTQDKFCFKISQLKDFFPLNSKEFRQLKKSHANNMVLDIAICNFDDANDVYNKIKFFVENPSDELVQELYSSCCEDGDPCTSLIDENKILILLPYKFTIDILRHEFIHYLQYIKNDSGTHLEVYSDYISKDIYQILEDKFDIDDTILEYLNDLSKYEPLLNDLFDELKIFKEKYFNNLSNLQFARFIYSVLFKYKLEKNINYLKRVLSYEHIDELINLNTYGLQLIIYFNILNYRVTAIKNLLFGYFSKELTPKF